MKVGPETGVIVEQANRDCWRIIIGGELVALANRMSNGGWCLFDTEDRRISSIHHKRPISAGKAMLERLRSAQQNGEPSHDRG